MISRIVELWLAGLAPGWDGLYRADGSARAIELGGGARLDWLDIGPAIDLDTLLNEDPENVRDVDVFPGTEVTTHDGSGYVCCGDGSHGSEGFFARLDARRDLVWIVALNDSNPFEKVVVNGSLITFANNLGNTEHYSKRVSGAGQRPRIRGFE